MVEQAEQKGIFVPALVPAAQVVEDEQAGLASYREHIRGLLVFIAELSAGRRSEVIMGAAAHQKVVVAEEQDVPVGQAGARDGNCQMRFAIADAAKHNQETGLQRCTIYTHRTIPSVADGF